MNYLFEAIGALGLIIICLGVVLRRRKEEAIMYIVGGVLLEAYSISIRNVIFIILQAIFVLAALYDLSYSSGGGNRKKK